MSFIIKKMLFIKINVVFVCFLIIIYYFSHYSSYICLMVFVFEKKIEFMK